MLFVIASFATEPWRLPISISCVAAWAPLPLLPAGNDTTGVTVDATELELLKSVGEALSQCRFLEDKDRGERRVEVEHAGAKRRE